MPNYDNIYLLPWVSIALVLGVFFIPTHINPIADGVVRIVAFFVAIIICILVFTSKTYRSDVKCQKKVV